MKKKESKIINRSLSQGNSPVNRIKKQTLSTKSVGSNSVDKPATDNSSSNKLGTHSNPCSRSRSPVNNKTLLRNSQAPQSVHPTDDGATTETDNIIISSSTEKNIQPQRPRSKTQNQAQQRLLTSSGSGRNSTIIIKKRSSINPPQVQPNPDTTTTQEGTSSSSATAALAEVFSDPYILSNINNINFNIATDPMIQQQPQLSNPSSQIPSNPNLFSTTLHETNPFKNFSTDSNSLPITTTATITNISQPVTNHNPFLTPGGVSDIPISNGQGESSFNYNPFI